MALGPVAVCGDSRASVKFSSLHLLHFLHKSICSSQFLLRDAWSVWLVFVRLRTWPASASNMLRIYFGGWRHRNASPSITQASYQTTSDGGAGRSVRVTESSATVSPASCETCCTSGANFPNVKLVHSNLLCDLWILLAWHVSTPVFMVKRC